MSDKTKAATPGRQCGYACQREKITRLAAGGQRGSDSGVSTHCAKLRSRENQRVNCYQPFGSMPRLLSSALPNSFSQLLVLVFSACASSSNCLRKSAGMRIGSIGDLPPPLGCLSLDIDMHMPIGLRLIQIGIYTSMCSSVKTTPPNGITSTERGLTTTLSK